MADSQARSGGEPAPENKDGGAAQTASESPPAEGKPADAPKKKSPIIWIIVGVVVALGLFFGLRAWWWGRSHVSTDDAYITGDLVNIGPAINGTLVELTVQEGDFVRKGQLIARLDDSGPRAAFNQAKANYQAAESMVPEAERTLEYQRASTQASIDKANAALAAQQAKTEGARRQVSLTDATTSNQVSQAHAQVSAAIAQKAQAEAQVRSAEATRESNRQAVISAQAGLANFRQQVQTAEDAVRAATAKLVGAQAEAVRAEKDEARDRTLYDQDAISAQAYDAARAQAKDLAAQVVADQAAADQAASQAESARRAADQASSQVEQARKVVAQSDAQVKAAQSAVDAAGEQVRVAQAGVGIAEANRSQVGIQQSNAASTESQVGESAADVITARAGTTQNQLRKEQVSTAQAQANQARDALKNAEVTLNDCYIYAPTDGMVVRKDANSGQVLAPGSTIVTITKGRNVWVEANFKETQLTTVRRGQSVEIDVDAFPGKAYHAVVESINEATGASTALLPPDNSTGNFTKVVQRIAVRIRFATAAEGGNSAEDLAGLRQGMSVTATIDTATGPGKTASVESFARPPSGDWLAPRRLVGAEARRHKPSVDYRIENGSAQNQRDAPSAYHLPPVQFHQSVARSVADGWFGPSASCVGALTTPSAGDRRVVGSRDA